MQKREKRQKLSRQVEKPITDDNEYGILGNPEGALDVVWLVTGDMELQISPCRQKENVK